MGERCPETHHLGTIALEAFCQHRDDPSRALIAGAGHPDSLKRAQLVVDRGPLRRLNLSWCTQLTDAAIDWLGQMSELRDLDLSFCGGITDRGLDRLAELPRLKRLRIEGSERISETRCQELAVSRPDLQLIR